MEEIFNRIEKFLTLATCCDMADVYQVSRLGKEGNKIKSDLLQFLKSHDDVLLNQNDCKTIQALVNTIKDIENYMIRRCVSCRSALINTIKDIKNYMNKVEATKADIIKLLES